ncbi:uncharacterized protein LOC107464069 [Arachis duranensis]|uniref:Uncharacterized protein LOC107464069 n=1 Tax=Arachis duranensis TaxID=130453 RepID=A0A6P4B996_ARADU|nr:uncharacterized protein LOC107464069 [Arachis duranensis]
MESTKEQHGLLHQILPPRLEDAGLEDCALPPESIHQAFLKAAAAVKSAAAIFSDDDGETAGDCVNDPWPAAAEGTSDAVIGIEPENELPGACSVEKGCEEGGDEVKVSGGSSCEVEEVVDEIVVGEGAKLGEGEEAPCIDELQGLGIDDDAKKNKKKNCEEEEKKPTLTEGYV